MRDRARLDEGRARRGPVGARRPRLTIAVAVVVMATLAVLGHDADRKLSAASLGVSGTESVRGYEMLADHFGASAPFAILLQGPAEKLDLQGPRLIATLRRDPEVTTVSPWDRGNGLGRLRPKPRTAVTLVDFHVSADTAVTKTVPHLDRVIRETTDSSVTVRAGGLATVARAIRDESIAASRRGELILAPILLIVLLLIFRSPVAAAIPLVFGGVTVVAARGLVSILADFADISSFALSVATMIALAVGVDYALLIVSRFREELAGGADPVEAAAVTRETAGRTVAFAGGILLMAVVIAVLLVPGALLFSLCATVAPVIAVAVAGPLIVGPAILVLVGGNIDRWRIGRRLATRTRWLAISRFALRKPALVAAGIVVLVLVIAAPALSLSTRPVTIEELSRGNPARLDVEAIERAVGGGWVSPFIVVAVSEDSPITDGQKLAALNRWQASVARQPGVQAVIGPGTLAKRAVPLQRESQRFLDDGKLPGGGSTEGLASASAALAKLHRGLGVASGGARDLALGSGRAEEGASSLAKGLSLATSGGESARGALDRFKRGAHRVARGGAGISLGLSLLDFSVRELQSEVAHPVRGRSSRLKGELGRASATVPTPKSAATTVVEKLESAWEVLRSMGVGTTDPRYPELAAAVREALSAARGEDPEGGEPYAPGYEGLPSAFAAVDGTYRRSYAEAKRLDAQLAGVMESISDLRGLATRLQSAIRRLRGGSDRLAAGSDRIAAGAGRLSTGFTRLAGGAKRLSDGLTRLRSGNDRLARGLSFSYRKTRPLVAGAREAQAKVSSARGEVRRSSPGIFDSGYFVLSALDGAPPRQRELAGQAVDLANGGQAARILVVDSQSHAGEPDAAALDRLRARARGLAAKSGVRVAVTGGVAQSVDYQRSTSARLAPLVVAITVATFLIMLVILRAVPLAAIAITLNLLSVAAAFGVLQVLTLLPESLPFGGTHHVDPVGAAAIFGVVFGLSIDYAVFLLMRMREGWDRDGDNQAAISYGLERTASVITGAATIMTLVFVVFATMPIQSVAQFGVGLAVAVMLDATVIRLMLVPALMSLIGPRVWWFPAWLERRLPRLDVDGGKVAL